MAKIILLAQGKDWRNSFKDYVKFQLGRANQDTFLTELSPIPARSNSPEVQQKLARCDDGISAKIEGRIEKLRAHLSLKQNPKLVICYGLPHRSRFERQLDIHFREYSSRIYVSEDKRYLLIPFMGQGQLSNVFLEELGNTGFLKEITSNP